MASSQLNKDPDRGLQQTKSSNWGLSPRMGGKGHTLGTWAGVAVTRAARDAAEKEWKRGGYVEKAKTSALAGSRGEQRCPNGGKSRILSARAKGGKGQ